MSSGSESEQRADLLRTPQGHAEPRHCVRVDAGEAQLMQLCLRSQELSERLGRSPFLFDREKDDRRTHERRHEQLRVLDFACKLDRAFRIVPCRTRVATA